jgi:hypothetical protein
LVLVPAMARSSAEAAAWASGSAQQAPSAQQAAALPPGEPVASVQRAVVPRPAAGHAPGARRQAAQVAASVGAEAPLRVAVAQAGVAAEVRLPAEAPDVVVQLPAVQRRAALPSAAAWAFPRDQPLPWPAPQPAARFARTKLFAHAKERRRIALP